MAFASACSGNEKPNATNEVRLSGFEDYYEMQKINYGIFVGGMSLNNDKAYVCEGEMSGKLYIDYAEKEPVDYNDNDGGKAYGDTTKPQFGFLPSLYDTAVGDLGNVDSFHISVFNANDRNVDLIFAVKSDGNKIAFSDGRTLEAGKWSHIAFEIKPYFFDQSLAVSEYVFYVYDDASATADSMTLYFDDVRILKTNDKTAPSTTAEQGEILAFNGMEDASLVLTTTAAATYPAFYAAYTGREIFKGQPGALEVTVRNGANWQYDVNPTTNGYKIEVLGSIVKERAAGAKGFSVDCKNDGNSDLYISLVASAGSGTDAVKSASVKVVVPAKGETTIVLDDLTALGGSEADGMSIVIDNWNLIGTYNVYFRNLKVTG